MASVDVFSVRDLALRSGELIRDAEGGRLSIITKDGRPAILAVPFDDRLLRHGIHRALALHLLEGSQVTLTQAARIADMSMEAFMEVAAAERIVVVDYPTNELTDDLKSAS